MRGPHLLLLALALAVSLERVDGALQQHAPRNHVSRRSCAAVIAPLLTTFDLRGALAVEDAVRMDGINGPGKSKTFFSDFTLLDSGLQYKDYKQGSGGTRPKKGDRVTLEWTGVTVGYQGRYFETRNKPKGGAFADDGFLQEPLAFTVGDGTVIPGIDEAVQGMEAGGIRRIIVPEEIGYPADGFSRIGPKPSTFSGERALDFVLASKSSMMDKTLMFDLKLTNVKPR